MDISLRDRTAFVCGSTSGIGKAIAWQMAEAGARIVLLARNREKLASVCASLPRPFDQKHSFLPCDFSFPGQVGEAAEDFLSENPQGHILVNNTGGPPPGSAYNSQPEQYEEAFRQHLVCSHILVRTLAPFMKQAKYGRIINITSTSVKEPISSLGISNTVRAAVANWAKSLSGDLGRDGITVNNILPGYTDTARLRSLIESRAATSGKSIEELERTMKEEIPAGRFAQAEEIACLAVFLASPLAGYINGVNIPVDGGRTHSL